MTPHHPLFDLRTAREKKRDSRSRRLKRKREARKEVILATDPRLLRVAEIRRILPALTREARMLMRTLKKCRIVDARCQHCGADCSPTKRSNYAIRHRCPKCNRVDWMRVPVDYTADARNPLGLQVHMSEVATWPENKVDEIARTLGVAPPPRPIDDFDVHVPTLEEEIEAKYDEINRPRSSADALVDPLSVAPPPKLDLPRRSPAEIDADWRAEQARSNPLLMPSEQDDGSDYYFNLRMLRDRGLA